MKLRLAFLLIAFCAAALAQSSAGYLFIAPGGVTESGYTSRTLQVGLGGDIILGKGIGVGAEIGAIAPQESFAAAVGVFAPGVSYHFIHDKRRKLDPYVTAGYTLFFREGAMNMFHFGAGTNFWFARHVGLRAEFRDQVYTRYRAEHFWGIRMGIAFR